MSVLENVYQILENDADVSSVVGKRIYLTVAEENVKAPFIVWTPISNVPYTTLNCPADSSQQRMQVDCYSHDPVQARILSEDIVSALENHGNIVSGALPSFEDDTKLHRYSMDVSFFHVR